MRQRIFGILACTTIIAIGGAAYALQAGQYRNLPGTVTGSYETGIMGNFKFVPVTAPDGIPSAPNGGACIIFRAKDLGFKKMWDLTCTKDEDCKSEESSIGYCHVKSQKCWSKPRSAPTDPEPRSDPYLCRRGDKLPNPVPINTDINISETPAPVSTPRWKINKNAKARVVSRLNCPGTPATACGPNGETFVHEWGEVTKL